jgi:hypothetical protein
MNRSECRRRNRRAFQRTADQIRAEGGGVYPLDAMPFFDAVFHERGCQVIRHLVESVTSGKAPLCLLCDNQISLAEPPAVIIAMTAHCDAPTWMVRNAVCCGRAKPWETLQQRIVATYRAGMISDLRALRRNISTQVGGGHETTIPNFNPGVTQVLDTNETLLRQAYELATEQISEARKAVDKVFGTNFASRNPGLVGAYTANRGDQFCHSRQPVSPNLRTSTMTLFVKNRDSTTFRNIAEVSRAEVVQVGGPRLHGRGHALPPDVATKLFDGAGRDIGVVGDIDLEWMTSPAFAAGPVVTVICISPTGEITAALIAGYRACRTGLEPLYLVEPPEGATRFLMAGTSGLVRLDNGEIFVSIEAAKSAVLGVPEPHPAESEAEVVAKVAGGRRAR